MPEPDTRPLAIVSSDSHIGPRLDPDLRAHCPAERLPEFDDWAARHTPRPRPATASPDTSTEPGRLAARLLRNAQTAGHYDVTARLADMDADGIAAEVIFHGSQNGQPLPFQGNRDLCTEASAEERELAEIGCRMYNRWLAEGCARAPDRLIGLAEIPYWNVERAVEEVRFAADAGLRGITLPTMRTGLLPYDDPAWDAIWAAAQDHALPLGMHAGAIRTEARGPHMFLLMEVEGGGWFARRAAHWMVLSGVFDRFPELKLALTEQPTQWWAPAMREFDSSYRKNRWLLQGRLPEPPSFYFGRNVFAAAPLSPLEVADAVEQGYWTNLMWGRDYPHIEGSWLGGSESGEAPSLTGIRHAFAGVEPATARAILGETAARVFGLDLRALARTAEEIGAPGLNEALTPLPAPPSEPGVMAFRREGPWY